MYTFFHKAREPFSSFSHMAGAAAAAIGLICMSIRAYYVQATPLTAFAVTLFCLSLIALYSASSLYHYAIAKEQILRILKKLDHSMIYVLIAGSYTPIVLRYDTHQPFLFLLVIWGITLAGIAMKLLWIDAPRFVGTILYLLLGWAVIFRLDVVFSMPSSAILLLATGGLSYTIGGIIYMVKKPNISHMLGFHEIFHLFVLFGSFLHYLVVFLFVL